jgi:hypothetical protein
MKEPRSRFALNRRPRRSDWRPNGEPLQTPYRGSSERAEELMKVESTAEIGNMELGANTVAASVY